jgi:SPP1 family predicted phage head-tail adaptor
MRAGLLKHRITIISPRTSARSTDGAPIVTHATILKDICADVQPMGGRESFRGDYRWADSDIRVSIRYTTVTIEPRYSLVFNGSTYNIDSVINTDQANRETVLIGTKTT